MSPMDELDPPQEMLAEAREATRQGDAGRAAAAYRRLLDRGVLGPEDRVEACRALLEAGGDARILDEIEAQLAAVEPDSPGYPEALRLQAELLERRGGRSPRDAAERVRAHMRAAQHAEPGARDEHLKGMFRALVRVAELEGNVPRLDPSLEGSLLLEEAAKAHRCWRQGGKARAAAEAYRRALEGGCPRVLAPYLQFWLGHLLSVDGQVAAALEVYEQLLAVGPPGSGGRRDVERRIRLLRSRLQGGEPARLKGEIERLRNEERLREGPELLETALHRVSDPETELELRRLLALTLTELGELELALGQWERIGERHPDQARVPLRALRARISRRNDPEAEGPASEPPPRPSAPPPRTEDGADEVEEDDEGAPEVPADPPRAPPSDLATYGDDAVEPASERVRFQEDLARRLDEAGQVREAVLAYRAAYLAAPPGREQTRLRKRVAAMAWHRLADPVLAVEALAGLSHQDRQAPDVQRLETDLHAGVVERFRQDVRLGLRTEAFAAVADLFRNLDVREPLRRELFGLHLQELSSCIYRRWELRRREVEDELQGFRSRGLAGNLVRLPNEAQGSPRHLAELEEELSILAAMGKLLEAREWATLRLADQEGQARRLEDRDGIRAMDAILGFVREVAQRRVRYGSEKPVQGWRDRIASWLPDGARELLLSDEGYQLNVAQDDLLGQFEAFLDLKYPSRRA